MESAPASDGKRIILHEVGPRDGLQIERQVVPTERKLQWIRGLIAAGLDAIQVGSFVRPDKVPQMADTDELFRRLADEPRGRTTLSCLVLNERGLERALELGVELICMGASASDTHSRKNSGMTSVDATRRITAMGQAAVKAGRQVQVAVQSAFGCGFEGKVPEERVVDMVRQFTEAGLTHISLADTAGYAHPTQVRRLFALVFRLAPAARVTCHFHDNYGLGMANAYAAMDVGVSTFETSMAGLGGCPFTKVASGNVCTEDFVHALRLNGLRADLDLDRLVEVAKDVAAFVGRELPGHVYKSVQRPA